MNTQRGRIGLVLGLVLSGLALAACGGSGGGGSTGAGGAAQTLNTVPSGISDQQQGTRTVAESASLSGATTTHLDRVILIYMENQGFDQVIGHEDANGKRDTPFITDIALRYGLATFYFGATHPSLPNYLAFLGGYTNNISDDNPSCFAVPSQVPTCHRIPYQNFVDQLESHNMTWAAFMQSQPSAGFLGPRFPTTGPVLYAQKHNPFVYYTDIATNSTRLKKILPLDDNASQLKAMLSNPTTAPNFIFISPDQCHDMHGTTTCTDTDALLRAGDDYVKTLVTTIQQSPVFSQNTAIFITWDENDFSSSLGCCGSGSGTGGGHVATIVITPHYTQPIRIAHEANHYTMLRTIEDAFGFPPLAEAAKQPPALMPLLP